MRKTAAALLAIAALVGCSSGPEEAEAAPKAAPFYSFIGWDWKKGRGPWASMEAFTVSPVVIRMTCDGYMTVPTAVVGSMPGIHSALNSITCAMAGRWVGRGTYTAHFQFSGRIRTPGYIWVATPWADPSCELSPGKKLLVCDNLRDIKYYGKKGRPTTASAGYEVGRVR